MRFQHYLLIFVISFIAIFFPILIKSQLVAEAEQVNNVYANYLITATEGAVDSVASDFGHTYLFNTEENRKKAVNSFYTTLSKCFNYEGSTYVDLLHYYVPCIFLIDTDGYYIEYTHQFINNSGQLDSAQIITPINKWSKTYSVGGNGITGTLYTVEYHLDDTISVTYKYSSKGEDKIDVLSGHYTEIYDKLHHPTELYDIMKDNSSFQKEKNDVIINILNEQMEYYINVHKDEFYNRYNAQYEFTLPQVTGEDWARLIDMPTVVSFLQGIQTPISGKNNSFLNIYSFAGAEVELQTTYYITDEGDIKYYHRDFCTMIPHIDEMTGYSMEQAAKHGAYPCPECIN